MKNASTVTLFFLNISCGIDRKGSNLFKVFLIMFEFIYLFAISQKHSNVGVGGENEPQVVISISKQRIVRPIYLKKALSKVSLRLFIKTLLAIKNFLL